MDQKMNFTFSDTIAGTVVDYRADEDTFTLQTIDGRQFDGRIKNFDRFAVIVEVNGADQLVFKHAIATIGTQRSVANYFAAHHA